MIRPTLLALALGLLAAPAMAEMTLDRATADPGTPVEIALDPPAGPGARLVVLPVEGSGARPEIGSEPVAAMPVAAGAATATLGAPDRPGSYRLRLLEDGRVRDEASLEVVVPPVHLTRVPVEVDAAESFVLGWTPRGAAGDSVVIETADGRPVEQIPLTPDAADKGRLALTAPAATGDYRLAYVDGASGLRLAEAAFTVTAGDAFLAFDATVLPGERVRVTHHGPGGAGYAIRLVAEDSGEVVLERSLADSEAPRGEIAISAPVRPGRYRMRYVEIASGAVLSDTVLIVLEPR